MFSKEELIEWGFIPEALELFHMSSSAIANISSLLLNEKGNLVILFKIIVGNPFSSKPNNIKVNDAK